MTRYILSGAESFTHTPEHPERTASRPVAFSGMNFDIIFQVWPNRAAMLKTVWMQQCGENFAQAWRPCVKEG